MTLSMPTKATKEWQAKHQANLQQMAAALKANGITKSRRRKLINKAASGRPSDLAEQARVSLALRRIAGKSVQG